MFMDPNGKAFFIISIILIVMGVVILVGGGPAGGAIACAVIGALGIFIHFKGKGKQ